MAAQAATHGNHQHLNRLTCRTTLKLQKKPSGIPATGGIQTAIYFPPPLTSPTPLYDPPTKAKNRHLKGTGF